MKFNIGDRVQIKDATGLPWVDLLDAMTTFCAERLEIKDE